MEDIYNPNSLDTLCAALAESIGIEPPAQAAKANPDLLEFVNKSFEGEKADRIIMYNPDAVAQWVSDKYKDLMCDMYELAGLRLPLCTVMPSVTPVCFGTMYTGAQPEVHGIRRYEKPVIKIDTIFDALLRAGKKVALIAQTECSVAKIFLERDMDYFIYDTTGECIAKAAELIIADKHDFIVVYNGNYDAYMHRDGTEAIKPLGELRANTEAFSVLSNLVKNNWKSHNTLIGFAMDHGCHDIDGGRGSHGLDMPEDLNIAHFYQCYPREK